MFTSGSLYYAKFKDTWDKTACVRLSSVFLNTQNQTFTAQLPALDRKTTTVPTAAGEGNACFCRFFLPNERLDDKLLNLKVSKEETYQILQNHLNLIRQQNPIVMVTKVNHPCLHPVSWSCISFLRHFWTKVVDLLTTWAETILLMITDTCESQWENNGDSQASSLINSYFFTFSQFWIVETNICFLVFLDFLVEIALQAHDRRAFPDSQSKSSYLLKEN